jgi:di/tricarboxylate transporter
MTPNPHAVAVIAAAVLAFFLYTRPRLRIELVSLLLLLALILIFHLVPYHGPQESFTDIGVLQSFGHPALVAICCLMILGRGLTMTGALEPAVRLLGRLWTFSRPLGLLVTLLAAGAASAFVNDTPVVVLMLPLLLGLAERTSVPASKTLMPVNFAVLAGGMLTSIGTSTNLLVLSIATDLGMRPLGIFAFTSTALAAFAVAVPYLWLLAPRMLPSTSASIPTSMRLHEAQIRVERDHLRLAGRSLAEVERALGRALPVVAVVRGGAQVALAPDLCLQGEDSLLLRDTPLGLRELAGTLRVHLFDRGSLSALVEGDLARVDMQMAELVVGNNSELAQSTLRDRRFAERHGVAVVGLHRSGGELLGGRLDVGDIRVAAGDVLLVQGPVERIAGLRREPDLLLLDSRVPLPRSPLAPWALAIMAVVVVVAATGVAPIHVAAFGGVVAMLIAGCVRLEGIGSALSPAVILLVASSLALGNALVGTGAAAWLARGAVALVGGLPPAGQLAAFMGLAAVLTNFVSNSAAAAVGTPIAAATALQLGMPMEPFVLAILFGANLSYATPMAYQTNLLVMNAAGYKFSDFLRVGGPLVLIMLTTLSLLLAARYSL